MIIARNEDESDEEYMKRVSAMQPLAGFPRPPTGWGEPPTADEDTEDDDADS